MKYTAPDAAFFTENRKQFSGRMLPRSLAVFQSNDLMPRSADQTHKFRQQPDLYYLSGIDQEETVLLLFPDAPKAIYREALFIKRTNAHIRVWEGHKFSLEEAQALSGIKNVFWLEEFDSIFQVCMHHAEHCYLNSNENDRASNPVEDQLHRFARQTRERFPLHAYHRAAPIMAALRTLKSEAEVIMLRKACAITRDAFNRVLATVRPGQMEYEVEAEIIHEFIRQGATGHAYSPIIASGANACILHYEKNDQRLNEGELLLMDFGAEYGNYNADLTRTIPVSGRFSDRQRAVYEAVLNVQKEAIAMMRPGDSLEHYNLEIGRIMEKELIGLGLLDAKAVADQDPDKPLYRKYFMHGTAHFLGLDVHDIGDRYAPITAGMVLTCEPGIYIPEEGIGVRIENDVLVTDGDPVDLMDDIPREVEEIESLMHAGVAS